MKTNTRELSIEEWRELCALLLRVLDTSDDDDERRAAKSMFYIASRHIATTQELPTITLPQ